MPFPDQRDHLICHYHIANRIKTCSVILKGDPAHLPAASHNSSVSFMRNCKLTHLHCETDLTLILALDSMNHLDTGTLVDLSLILTPISLTTP